MSAHTAGRVVIQRIGRSKADLERFFDVADRIYAGDPNFVAPLRSDVAKVFQDENPFFRHGEMQLFVARRGVEDVGRIAAIVDRNHNAFHGEKAAFFGFFESIDDPAVAGRLLDAAALWGRERKMTVLRGPANPTLNDEAGLLVDGFDSPPVLMMTYNPRVLRRPHRGAGVPQGEGPARLLVPARGEAARAPVPRGRPVPQAGAGHRRPQRLEGRPGARTSRRSGRSTTRPGRRTGASSR